MKVYRVGRYHTRDPLYAVSLREVVRAVDEDPGPPVELEMTEEEWSLMKPTAIHAKDPNP